MIKAQLQSISRREISLPNIFKWNVTGRMTQMRKQKAAPMMAEMTSKEGTRMASKTIVQVTPIRKTARRVLVRKVDWLKRFGLTEAARGSMRESTSSVDMIGEQLLNYQQKETRQRATEGRETSPNLPSVQLTHFNGNLVNGIIATRISTTTCRASGYS